MVMSLINYLAPSLICCFSPLHQRCIPVLGVSPVAEQQQKRLRVHKITDRGYFSVIQHLSRTEQVNKPHNSSINYVTCRR